MLITEQKQIDRIVEIIDSCETDLQLKSCHSFINPKFFEYDWPLNKLLILTAIVAKEVELFVQFDWKKTLEYL